MAGNVISAEQEQRSLYKWSGETYSLSATQFCWSAAISHETQLLFIASALSLVLQPVCSLSSGWSKHFFLFLQIVEHAWVFSFVDVFDKLDDVWLWFERCWIIWKLPQSMDITLVCVVSGGVYLCLYLCSAIIPAEEPFSNALQNNTCSFSAFLFFPS